MKQIIELNDKGSHLAIRIEGGQGWHEAYTINQWINLFGSAHGITNTEYVRACSREQADERTGKVYKLPDGWVAAKHKSTGRIYVYRENRRLVLARNKNKKTVSWDSITLDDNLIRLLRAYKYQALLLERDFKARVTFHSDGSYECLPFDDVMPNKQFDFLSWPFKLSWQMELVGTWRKDIDAKVEITKRFAELLSYPKGQEAIKDFNKRCLWCAEYKQKNKRQDARFCKDEHRIYFMNWKKDTISKYRIAIKTKESNSSEYKNVWYPELLNHALIAEAIFNRLREIQPNLT